MDTSVLLSLSAFTSLLACFVFCGTPALPSGVSKQQSKDITVDTSSISPRKDSNVGLEKKRADRCSSNTRMYLPDVYARWPWPRQINPHYAEIKKEASAWMTNFRAFSPKAQDAFDRCDFNLLACLTYPDASKEHARAGADLMHIFFMFDEFSDRSTPSEVRNQKNIMMDAFRNPHTMRPRGEWIGGEISRQFWERTIQSATPVSQKRFIQTMDEYLESVVQESLDKSCRRILNIENYIEARRRTSGVKPSFSIYELGLDIPDEVMSHPTVQEVILAAVDMVAFCNDIYSYNLEQMRGDDLHNIITCVMHEHHTDVNGAMMWVEAHLLGAWQRFEAAKAALPQWEDPKLNTQIRKYCDCLGQWVRGHDEWSFEGERYFGKKGPQIKKERWMSLLPKEHEMEIGPVHVDSRLL